MRIIGIDPGVTGAVALITAEYGDEPIRTEVHDIPTVEKSSGKGREIDAPSLLFMLQELEAFGSNDTFAFVEQVNAMPPRFGSKRKAGSTSMFGFGVSVGIIRCAVVANQMPLVYVTPQKWKKQFGLIGKGKDASLGTARLQFPHLMDQLKLKKHDGRAEALLIARYGLKQMTQGDIFS